MKPLGVFLPLFIPLYPLYGGIFLCIGAVVEALNLESVSNSVSIHGVITAIFSHFLKFSILKWLVQVGIYVQSCG